MERPRQPDLDIGTASRRVWLIEPSVGHVRTIPMP